MFVVVALAAFGLGSLFDQRNAQARLIKERLANERKAPELAAEEELALLRDEQLSQIPALDTLLRRSARVTDIQKMLAQAGMSLRAGNFLGLSALAGVAATILAYALSKRVEVAWVALLVGFVLPYSYVSFRRNKRFEKFEELFPEAIDTLARAVRAGHAFTTALEMITDEVAEPVAGEFRQLYEEQKFGMPVRDALINLTERMPLVDVKFFVTAVMLQRETGGNLAEILDNLVVRNPRALQDSAPGARLHRPGPPHHGAADGDAAHHRRGHAGAESRFHSPAVFRSDRAHAAGRRNHVCRRLDIS